MWFGTLNYLNGRYFATSISLFPLFCLLFQNNAKITLDLELSIFRQIYDFNMFRAAILLL